MHRAGHAEIAAVFQNQPHFGCRRGNAAAGQRAPQRQQFRARLLHIDKNRIEPLNHRQRINLIAGNQRANRRQRTPNPAGDRRRNRGKGKIDFRRFKLGAVLGDSRLGLPCACLRVGQVLRAYRFDCRKWFQPPGADPRRLCCCLRRCQIGLRLRRCCRIKPWVNTIKCLSALHDRAFGKHPFADDACHLRSDFRCFERRYAPGEFRHQRHVGTRSHDIADLWRPFVAMLARWLLRTSGCSHGSNYKGDDSAGTAPMGKVQCQNSLLLSRHQRAGWANHA